MSETPLYMVGVSVGKVWEAEHPGEPCDDPGDDRGSSLIKNNPPLGPYSRTMPKALRWSSGEGSFLCAR